MPLDQSTYQQLYNDPNFAKTFPTDQDRAKALASMDPEFAALPPHQQLSNAQQMFSGPRFSSQQHLSQMAAGQDIPPNSPLNTGPRSAAQRYINRLGVPTQPQDIPQMGKGMAIQTILNLVNPVLGATVSAVQAPQQMYQDAKSGNLAGLAGDITPYALAALGLRGGGPPIPKGSIPIEMERGPLLSGGLADTLGTLSPRLLHAVRLGQRVLGKGNTKTIGYMEKPPPEVSYTGTDFPMNQAATSSTIPEASNMPSPPLRSGQDWFQPPKEAAYGEGGKPYSGTQTKGAARGGKVPLAKVEPRSQATMEGNVEHGNLPVSFKESYITSDQAAEGHILGLKDEQNFSIISAIAKDKQSATITHVSNGKPFMTEILPVRPGPSASVLQTALKNMQKLMEAKKAAAEPEE